MSRVSKFNIKELNRALTYLSEKVGATTPQISFDELGRLILMDTSPTGSVVKITLYDSDPDRGANKMAEITETRRL